MKKRISLLLGILLALSLGTACSKEPNNPETETTPVGTIAPETTAPETKAPETTAPETKASETKAPETTAPETTAPETAEPETTVPETEAPETTVAAEFDLDEAFTSDEYKNMRYRLYLPKGYSEEKEYPLFVYLHNSSNSGTDNKKPLEEVKMFFEHPESPLYDSIVLVPQTNYNLEVWRGKAKGILMELTKIINETYSTDPNRQYYVGTSDGGDAIWDLMETHPNRISACISSNGKGIHFLKYPDGTIAPVEYFESMKEIPLCIAYDKEGHSSIGMPMGEEYKNLLSDFLVEQGAENLYFKEITEYMDNYCPILADSEDISVLTWLYSQSRPTTEDPEKSDKSPFEGVVSYVFNAVEEFETDEFTASNGMTLAYGYYLPEDYDESKDYPLLVFLHGNGAQGSDGMGHLSQVNAYFSSLESPVYDSIVLMPQCPEDKWWGGEPIDAVIELIDAFNTQFSTDLSRQYVAGISMGGCGTWDIVLQYPEHVSGAVPVAGEGPNFTWNYSDGTTTPEFDPRILEVPICYIYDTWDEYSMAYIQRSIVRTMEDYGAKYFTYRESTGIGHAVCGTHVTAEDLSVLEWLYAQRRDTTVPIVPPDPLPFAKAE